MTTATQKRYNFTFYLSGKDVKGNPITNHSTYHQSFSTSSQQAAEKKLRSQFYKSVQVNIQSVTITG